MIECITVGKNNLIVKNKNRYYYIDGGTSSAYKKRIGTGKLWMQIRSAISPTLKGGSIRFFDKKEQNRVLLYYTVDEYRIKIEAPYQVLKEEEAVELML